jgi:hypothetical protein
MSLISSVTSAAATLAAGLDPAPTSSRTPGLPAASAGGLAPARSPDALTAKLAAGATGKPAGQTASKAAAKTTSKTTAKSSSAKKTTAKAKSTSTGYAKASAGDDFAFLKDATLSVEEKLFRFLSAIARRSDDEVLKKMEEMKGGAAKATAGSTPSSGTTSSGGTGGAKKSSGLSVWGALKSLVPPLGMAAQLVGDAKLKSLISQVSGPVLAAAATALGMPALAPLALKAGPGLATALINGKLGGSEVAAAVGGTSTASSSSSGSTSSASSSSSSSTSSSAAAAATGKNEQVQMMELQRLVDKQKEMFAMVSNILRAQHDTRMAVIGNVR